MAEKLVGLYPRIYWLAADPRLAAGEADVTVKSEESKGEDILDTHDEDVIF